MFPITVIDFVFPHRLTAAMGNSLTEKSSNIAPDSEIEPGDLLLSQSRLQPQDQVAVPYALLGNSTVPYLEI